MISVIIPVYNVQDYLARCVDSVLAQTYSELEIILVDDGSLDMSGDMCDDYALQDRRIRVIHKSNGGLSDARNAGLDVVSGDYVTFIDGFVEQGVAADLMAGIAHHVQDVGVLFRRIGREKEGGECNVT